MFFIDRDPKEWAKENKLKIIKGICLKCGREVITDTPFRTRTTRGLCSLDHGCGDEYRHFTYLHDGKLE